MTREITTGFEIGFDYTSTHSKGGPDMFARGGNPPTLQTGTFRSGTRAAQCNAGAGNLDSYVHQQILDLTFGRGYYGRAYLRFSTVTPGAATDVLGFADSTSGSPMVVTAQLQTNGTVQLRDITNGVQIGSSSAALSANTWYRFELYLFLAVGSGDDACELRIDGATVASGSALTLSTTAVSVLRAGILNTTTMGANNSVFVDDVALNSDQGADQNSWPGVGKIVCLHPVSDSLRDTNWLAGAGGTTNLFDAVDNVPPAGLAGGSATNTSQIKNAASTTTENYEANCTDYTTAGIGGGDTITVVQAVMNDGCSTGNAVFVTLAVVSNPSQSEANFAAGDADAAVGTYPVEWKTHWGVAVYNPTVTLGTQPVLRTGKRTASTDVLYLDAMGIYVEYVPVAAQIAVPTGDVSTGDWAVVPLYPKVDEAVFDDSDYISSAMQPVASTAELSFGALTDPAVDTGHVVHYRFRNDPSMADQVVTLVVSLMQGSTLIASWTHNVLNTAWTTVNQTLTGVQAAAITDYSALSLQFQATQ